MPVFMPIFIKPLDWQQTPSNITIKIPSYGVPANKIDFLTHEIYIKAHYQQYFFEIFLFKPINVSKSNCTVTDKNIIFELTKHESEIWEKLEEDIDKLKKKEIRQQIIQEFQKKSEEEQKLKINKNAELKRIAVREQISLDTKKNELIENIKKTEKENALKQYKLWEENKEINSNDSIKTEFKKSSDTSKYKSSKPKINNEKIKETSPNEYTNINKEFQKYNSVKPKINNENIKILPVIPLPRKNQTISIEFTKREFSTPMRESKAQEEQDWLAKQALARRSAGFDSKDLRPEERNPQFLKAKGNEFFKAKNYLGAISAYSEGINISKDYVDLYINRSAAHFAVGNLNRTIEDCSTALDIMKPAVPANLEMRAKCIARRGAALCKLGLQKEGISELEAALELVPNNDSLRQDIERIKNGLSSSEV